MTTGEGTCRTALSSCSQEFAGGNEWLFLAFSNWCLRGRSRRFRVMRLTLNIVAEAKEEAHRTPEQIMCKRFVACLLGNKSHYLICLGNMWWRTGLAMSASPYSTDSIVYTFMWISTHFDNGDVKVRFLESYTNRPRALWLISLPWKARQRVQYEWFV